MVIRTKVCRKMACNQNNKIDFNIYFNNKRRRRRKPLSVSNIVGAKSLMMVLFTTCIILISVFER